MLLRYDDFQRDDRHAFGTLLTTLRINARQKVTQASVITHLPGWTASSYSRLENGDIAPRFDQLATLYRALQRAGISFSPQARQQFVDLARKRIAIQRTYKDIRTDDEWAQLRFELARMDGYQNGSADHSKLFYRPLLAETAHLVGRERWREEVVSLLNEPHRKKLMVIRGPAGVGKSSELNWLATQLLRQQPPVYRAILHDFRSEERARSPEDALDVLLGTMLAELECPLPQTVQPSFEERTLLLLERLERAKRPVVVLVDHSECLLHEQGALASCWERFLSRFLRSQHSALLVLATNQWPGWFGGEHLFISEVALPPLTQEKAVLLLQQLGLETVPVPLLQEVYQKVGGIPLCLEWVAALVKQPLQAEDWEEFDAREEYGSPFPGQGQDLTHAVKLLLEEPHVFGGSLATAITPILDRIVANQCLSRDARHLLQVLSVAVVPLARPALVVLCTEGPRPLDELRRASLVVTYPHRAQLLPMVASAVSRHLTKEQVQQSENLLIQAYTAWLQAGISCEREQGIVITELTVLFLKYHRLLEAAQLLARYGSLAFNLGHGTRLARLARDAMQNVDWRVAKDSECGGVLLHYQLAPFLGEVIDAEQLAADYRRILGYIIDGAVEVHPLTEVYITHHLMLSEMNALCFQEAQALLDACVDRLAPQFSSNIDLHASLLERRALLLGRWGEWAEEQGDRQTERELREETITIRKECNALLEANIERVPPLESSSLKIRLARSLNSLAYHLNRTGRFEEALQAVDRSIALKEQGFLDFGALASSYGEKAQALAGLGRFQEALLFDQKALEEVQRLAQNGHTFSQDEQWIYLVDRGRLYLQLGRVDEAERLLREALPHIHARRRIYRMQAKKALEEINQWRLASPDYQLDWRWLKRYRDLASFDAFWWLAHAGPFTEDEQREWDRLSNVGGDENAHKNLENILAQSRQRELAEALREGREPRLWYPAIPIEDIRHRVDSLLELDADVARDEPNAIVRHLYREVIEEQLCFLHLFEATYEGNGQRFWEMNRLLHPEPTADEIRYTLSRVRRLLLQGLMHQETSAVSRRVIDILRNFRIPIDLSYSGAEAQELQRDTPLSPPQTRRMISPQAARRFFEAALRESGYGDWQVILDQNASGPRVESGLRHFFLPATTPLSIEQVRDYVLHELGDHIASAVAGEHSPLGLLGMGLKGYLATREGVALYQEQQSAALLGKAFDESRIWMGTLATGLASGVLAPPQTFLSLYAFFESFILLYRLLKRPDEDIETAQEKARSLALTRCLRTYRGVPNLEETGICYTKDALYLRGLQLVEQAVAQDETIIDRLSVGKVALAQLPDLEELGIVMPFQPLKKLAHEQDLEAWILSFEETGKEG